MEFCDECGSALVPEPEKWVCKQCGWETSRESSSEVLTAEDEQSGDDPGTEESGSGGTRLEGLSTTEAGSVRKKHAMRWLDSLEEPSDEELRAAVTAKPEGFTGSTFPADVSTIRVTGEPEFIETFAGLLKPFLDFEGPTTRLELNVQKVKDRDTDEFTGNYALYLNVAERA